MSTSGTDGWSGKADDAKKDVTLPGVPGVLLMQARGPWSLVMEWYDHVTEKSRTRRMRAMLRHLDGRSLEMPSALEGARLADSLNGWEQARWFHPDHPERWRMQGDALPHDPAQARFDALATLTCALVGRLREFAGQHPLADTAEANLIRWGVVPARPPARLTSVPTRAPYEAPGQQPLGAGWTEPASG